MNGWVPLFTFMKSLSNLYEIQDQGFFFQCRSSCGMMNGVVDSLFCFKVNQVTTSLVRQERRRWWRACHCIKASHPVVCLFGFCTQPTTITQVMMERWKIPHEWVFFYFLSYDMAIYFYQVVTQCNLWSGWRDFTILEMSERNLDRLKEKGTRCLSALWDICGYVKSIIQELLKREVFHKMGINFLLLS